MKWHHYWHLLTQTSWVVFMNPWGRVPKQRISSSLHVSLVTAGAQSFIDEPEVTQQGAWKGESRTEATSPAPFHCPVPFRLGSLYPLKVHWSSGCMGYVCFSIEQVEWEQERKRMPVAPSTGDPLAVQFLALPTF